MGYTYLDIQELPKFKLTDERKAALFELIDRLTDDQLADLAERASDRDEALQELRDAIEHVGTEPEADRDVRTLYHPDSFPMLIAGGTNHTASGDGPGDYYESFRTIGCVQRVWDVLVAFAREDHAVSLAVDVLNGEY